MKSPRISVVIITYKQEVLIKRAIDSILAQLDYVCEICVSDDCSPDGTWEVLQQYSAKHPGLFKLNRNIPNLGIFKNVEYSWSMPSGDMVYQLSGDDECPAGWLNKVADFVVENELDFTKDICVYGDYKCQYPNGDYFIRKNHFALKDFDLVSMSMRGYLGNRSACYSRSIMNKFFKVSIGRSYVAEWAQEIQLPLFTKKAFYIPSIGNIYYTRIGVNVHFDKTIIKERTKNYPYMQECLQNAGYCLTQKDKYYIKGQHLKYQQLAEWTFVKYMKIFFYNILSNDVRYGFWYSEKRKFKRLAFAILRRLPHNKPLSMEL